MRHLLRPLTLICWLLCGLGSAWAGGGGVSALMAANPHQGFDTGSTSPSHRYGFQGEVCPERSRRESDDEMYGDGNAIAFTYRVHACPERSRRDPRIGRFLSVDPLAPEYPWNSPYAFSENRVVDRIELEGRETALIPLFAEYLVKLEKLRGSVRRFNGHVPYGSTYEQEYTAQTGHLPPPLTGPDESYDFRDYLYTRKNDPSLIWRDLDILYMFEQVEALGQGRFSDAALYRIMGALNLMALMELGPTLSPVIIESRVTAGAFDAGLPLTRAAVSRAAVENVAARGSKLIKFPGKNPAKAPKGFEWRGKPGSKPGSKDGNWYNPKTGESLRPD